MKPLPKAPERAVVFVDGNNCYHALKKRNVGDLRMLNYAKVSKKVVGVREWIGTRYYVGQVRNEGNTSLYDQQRAYVTDLLSADARMSVHFGRLEAHTEPNELARRLKRYLAETKVRIDPEVFKDLVAMGNAMEYNRIVLEKAAYKFIPLPPFWFDDCFGF